MKCLPRAFKTDARGARASEFEAFLATDQAAGFELGVGTCWNRRTERHILITADRVVTCDSDPVIIVKKNNNPTG